jgi:hypothetical protein
VAIAAIIFIRRFHKLTNRKHPFTPQVQYVSRFANDPALNDLANLAEIGKEASKADDLK